MLKHLFGQMSFNAINVKINELQKHEVHNCTKKLKKIMCTISIRPLNAKNQDKLETLMVISY